MRSVSRLFLVPVVSLVTLACGADPGAQATGRASAAERGSERDHPKTLAEFDRMIGVPRPYTGATNPIRGLAGGGLPWVVHEGEAKVLEDGTLDVRIEGLVFDPNDPTNVARGIAGTNTIPQMKAILSCQTVAADGTAQVANVSTALFPVTTGAAPAGGGDLHVVEQLAVPSPCIAPIVFVTSPGGAWFAATAL